MHNLQNSLDRFVTVGRENRCTQNFLCVGAGIIGKNSTNVEPPSLSLGFRHESGCVQRHGAASDGVVTH